MSYASVAAPALPVMSYADVVEAEAVATAAAENEKIMTATLLERRDAAFDSAAMAGLLALKTILDTTRVKSRKSRNTWRAARKVAEDLGLTDVQTADIASLTEAIHRAYPSESAANRAASLEVLESRYAALD